MPGAVRAWALASTCVKPKYRFRHAIRRRLPWFLINLGLAAKGKQDCGNHSWYNSDGVVERCHYCEPGERPHDPAHFAS